MAKIPKPKYLLLNGNKMAKFMKSSNPQLRA